MCTTNVNGTQLKAAIEQIDEAVALTRRWTHRTWHSAEDGQLFKTAARLKEVQSLIDEVRSLLSEAGDLSEEEALSPNVSVKLM